MEKEIVLSELKKNLNEFRFLEDKISMLQLAFYQKSVNEFKNNKINELKEYFSNQVNYYGQDISEYQTNIDNIIKEYSKAIDNLIEVYNQLYIKIFQKLQNAINNQTIAIGNISILENKRNNENSKKIDNNILTIAQKKVNYSVIIEECKARLKWCIENVKVDINKIFENNFYQLDIYNNSFFQRIKRKILNYINGKKSVKDVINKYKNENLKKILDLNKSETITIIALTAELLKQISNVEKQITIQYENSYIN